MPNIHFKYVTHTMPCFMGTVISFLVNNRNAVVVPYDVTLLGKSFVLFYKYLSCHLVIILFTLIMFPLSLSIVGQKNDLQRHLHKHKIKMCCILKMPSFLLLLQLLFSFIHQLKLHQYIYCNDVNLVHLDPLNILKHMLI